MRNLLFAFIAMFMFSGVSFGQSKKSSNLEDVYLKAAMTTIVSEAKPHYKKGDSYEAFITNLGGDVKSLSKQEDALMKDVYSFLSNGSSNANILSNYNGNSLKQVVNGKGFDAYGAEAKGDKCRFFCKLAKFLRLVADFIDGVRDL